MDSAQRQALIQSKINDLRIEYKKVKKIIAVLKKRETKMKMLIERQSNTAE